MQLRVSMGHVDWTGSGGTMAGAQTWHVAWHRHRNSAGSRDVSGAEAGFELGTGQGGGLSQVTWGCRFQYWVTRRRLSLRWGAQIRV